ncbi:MAG TPA: hypothetical protein VNN21_03055 [Dehalococcoidia bacterium]|nr:hypothetical protein [Dehalococcoidia bacterium]
MTVEALFLRPRRLSQEYRIRPLFKGYGERKRAREAAKIPLLAGLPGMIKAAEEYEAAQTESQARWIRQLRRKLAADWLSVLRWRRTATLDQRCAFASEWAYLPHTPEYAVDLIRSLEKERT